MTEPVDTHLLQAIVAHLRSAGEPVREAVLFERVAAGLRPAPTTDHFLAALTMLEAHGRVRMRVEHDLPAHDPAPFQPRYYFVVQD